MTNTIRKELLLITAAPIFVSKGKCGVEFVLRQREQSNSVCMVKRSIAPQSLYVPKFVAKKCIRNNVFNFVCREPPTITKMVISKKKLKKSKKTDKKSRRENNEVHAVPINNRMNLIKDNSKQNITNALTKIQSIGLLMRQFRSGTNFKRARSLTHSNNLISEPNSNNKMDDYQAEYPNTQPLKNIKNFGQNYLEVNLESKVRRKSSYYGSLSEGTITEEEDITIN